MINPETQLSMRSLASTIIGPYCPNQKKKYICHFQVRTRREAVGVAAWENWEAASAAAERTLKVKLTAII